MRWFKKVEGRKCNIPIWKEENPGSAPTRGGRGKDK